MENNEIMKRLLDDNNHNESQQRATWARSKNKDEDLPISKIRVVTAKYKVYIVLVLIFICVLLFEYIPDIKKSYNWKKDSYSQVQAQLRSVEDEIKKAENNKQYLSEIKDNEESLKTCLNERNRDVCLSLPENWMVWEWDEKQYDFSVPLSYLQVHSLYSNKMPVDEKKVLKNLNEYLIKQDILWGTKSRVGDILKISIWDPTSIKDNHFFSVPVNVTIEFKTVWDLTWFLYNVEKKLVDNWENRILYKIQSVSYDIIANDEPQVTDISMLAYYYYDERFENLDEEISEDSNNEENNQSNESQKENTASKNDWWDSKSFLNKIFK